MDIIFLLHSQVSSMSYNNFSLFTRNPEVVDVIRTSKSMFRGIQQQPAIIKVSCIITMKIVMRLEKSISWTSMHESLLYFYYEESLEYGAMFLIILAYKGLSSPVWLGVAVVFRPHDHSSGFKLNIFNFKCRSSNNSNCNTVFKPNFCTKIQQIKSFHDASK